MSHIDLLTWPVLIQSSVLHHYKNQVCVCRTHISFSPYTRLTTIILHFLRWRFPALGTVPYTHTTTITTVVTATVPTRVKGIGDRSHALSHLLSCTDTNKKEYWRPFPRSFSSISSCARPFPQLIIALLAPKSFGLVPFPRPTTSISKQGKSLSRSLYTGTVPTPTLPYQIVSTVS